MPSKNRDEFEPAAAPDGAPAPVVLSGAPMAGPAGGAVGQAGAEPAPAQAAPASAPAVDTIEAWSRLFKTPTFLFEGAKYLRAWGIGQMVTRDDYLNAVKDFHGVDMG